MIMKSRRPQHKAGSSGTTSTSPSTQMVLCSSRAVVGSPGPLSFRLAQRRRTPSKRVPRKSDAIPPSTAATAAVQHAQQVVEAAAGSKSVAVNHKKSSPYRGVTMHRVSKRFEAHLWDKSAYNQKQNKKGKQVYLGAYDEEKAAARAYDLAALKYWGSQTLINFKLELYVQELQEMQNVSKEEYLARLRRKSSGFSRGRSKYRGVARHHHNGRWEARIKCAEGKKYLYLGTFGTEEEAAEAYDRAAIDHKKAAAVTNFDLSHYINLVQNKQNKIKGRVRKDSMARAIGTSGGRGSSVHGNEDEKSLDVQANLQEDVDMSNDVLVDTSATTPTNLWFVGELKLINPPNLQRLSSDNEKSTIFSVVEFTNHLTEETTTFFPLKDFPIMDDDILEGFQC